MKIDKRKGKKAGRRKQSKWIFHSLTLVYGQVNIPGRTDR